MKAQGWAFNPLLAQEHEARVTGKAATRDPDGKVVGVMVELSRYVKREGVDWPAATERMRLTLTAEEAADLGDFLLRYAKDEEP